MLGINFTSGMKLIRDVMSWLQLSKEEAIEQRMLDINEYGIVKGEPVGVSLNEFRLTPTITGTYSYVSIGEGTAYDSTGNRIVVGSVDIATLYTPSNATLTTDNGDIITNWPLTPKSTGAMNIPLSTGVINYIWIRYLLCTDDPSTYFTLHEFTGFKQFYKLVDGFKILVNTTNDYTSPPADEDGNEYIYLGSVNGMTTSELNRSYFGTKERRVKVSTPLNDLSDKTQSYTLSSTVTINQIFVDDHVRAIGNGTVSATNPHGTSIYDAGFNDDYRVSVHNGVQHTSGFISEPLLSSTACLSPTIIIGGGAFSDALGLKKLAYSGSTLSSYGEYIVLEGNSGSPEGIIIDKNAILGTNALDTSWYQVNFDGLATNNYYVYIDKATSMIASPVLAAGYLGYPIGSDYTKLTICEVNITNHGGATPTIGINSITDLRKFGTDSRKDIQYESIGTNEIEKTTNANKIQTINIADSAVTTAKIPNNSITELLILNGAVTTNKIASLNVTTDRIADVAVTTRKFHPSYAYNSYYAEQASTGTNSYNNVFTVPITVEVNCILFVWSSFYLRSTGAGESSSAAIWYDSSTYPFGSMLVTNPAGAITVPGAIVGTIPGVTAGTHTLALRIKSSNASYPAYIGNCSVFVMAIG